MNFLEPETYTNLKKKIENRFINTHIYKQTYSHKYTHTLKQRHAQQKQNYTHINKKMHTGMKSNRKQY